MMLNVISSFLVLSSFAKQNLGLPPSVDAFQNEKDELKCAPQCVCSEEFLSQIPTLKWLYSPVNQMLNRTRINNEIISTHEDIYAASEDNDPLINSASCTHQEGFNFIDHSELSSEFHALTVLYGSSATDSVTRDEFKNFSQLLVLDLRGYELDSHPNSIYTYSPLQMHQQSLFPLINLRYLNIENVLIPSTNQPAKPKPQKLFHRAGNEQKLNLTFIVEDSSDEEVIPYEEYKRRREEAKANLESTNAFSHLANLEFLRLYKCHISFITWDMFDGLSLLETLWLEGNSISDLPQYAFYGMPALKILVLKNNKIEHLRNESLAGLFSLQYLDLSSNLIKQLSDTSFPPMTMLQQLSILDNLLEKISSSTFEVMNNTLRLEIGSTDKSFVIASNSFNGLSHLQRLQILGLKVKTLKRSLFNGLTRLQHLKIAGTVEFVEFDTFTNSLELKELVLRSCSIRSVSIDAFYGLIQLMRLDLSHNKLEFLPPGVFDQLYSLKELSLSHNLFVSLPRFVLGNLAWVQMIRVDGNPWNCSCEMIDWLSLNVNKIKEKRLIDETCTDHDDKRPCDGHSYSFDVYTTNSKIIPQCSSPQEYAGWNAIQVVQKLMGCLKNHTETSGKKKSFKSRKQKKIS